MKGMQDRSRPELQCVPTRCRLVSARAGICLLVLMLGCVQSRSSWRERFGMMPSSSNEKATLPADSIAGRIQNYQSLTEKASSMSPADAERHAKSIAAVLADESPTPVKVAMVRCLGKLPTPAALDGLSTALRDADAEVRRETCESLSTINSPRAMNLLADTVAQETDVDVRLTAVRGLGRFEDPRAVQALGQALNDRDPAVQFVTMQSLRKVTGKKLGDDVRLWKDTMQSPEEILATRPERDSATPQ